MSAPLDRAWLLRHLPHQGGMNLLDRIVGWDDATVTAVANGHRDPRHPLRRGELLPITAGIEYGAQAAAAHGALTQAMGQGPGYLASVRSVAFHAERLDDLREALDVFAEQLGASDAGVLYRFTVSSAARLLVEGRLSVAFPR